MDAVKGIIKYNIDTIKTLMGNNNDLIIKDFIIGKNDYLDAAIIYMNGLANKDIIDRDILNPLMLHVEENLCELPSMENFICKKYITMSNTYVEKDISKAVETIKRGKTVVLFEDSTVFIIVDTTGGVHRPISEPLHETAVRGPREAFVENLETNVSILRRRIKDKNLLTETLVVGKKSQTDLIIVYMDDIVDKDILNEIRSRITAIDIDNVTDSGIIEQCIEKHTFSIFPQSFVTERPDIVQANLMEGRIALMIEGTSFVVTLPALFVEFFQAVEDYYQRTLIASFTRLVRYIAAFAVLTLPSIYVTLIKFNPELIPSTFIKSLIESRKGIALTPFMSVLSMNLVIEFLREGGIRLPSKIGQTLSVVGGIIIGNAAINAKVVSSTTLLVVGTTTIATFLMPNYEMSISLRILGFPMLILANWLGALGVAVGLFFIICYLCSLDSFGVPYFSLHKSDLKDTFIRSPIWKMNKRAVAVPNNNPIRQKDFKNKVNGGKDD